MVSIIVHLTSTGLAETRPSLPPHTLAEKWILKQVTEGEVADLGEKFPDEADRVLGAAFLEKLLTGSIGNVAVHRHGVRIKNGVLAQRVDLQNAEIPHETWLENCRFEDDVDLSKSLFHKRLSFKGSSFKEANFNNMKVGGHVVFTGAVFAGTVDFGNADITGNLEADEAQFNSDEQVANFNSMRVGVAAFFKQAAFAGPVNFVRAEITGNFEANEARFNNAEHTANFNSMKVGGHALLNGATFAGPVSFGSANITGNFETYKAQFNSAEQVANFNSMKVGVAAFFKQAAFAGPVNFVRAEIADNFEANGAQFNSAEKNAQFGSMKVGGHAFFNGAAFAGPVGFGSADIVGNFEAPEAQFNNAERTANFNSMKVGGDVFFNRTLFAGPVSMSDARFLDVLIRGPNGNSPVVPRLDLSRTVIRRELRIEELNLKDMIATSLQVVGPTSLNRLTIEGTLNLEHSRFLTVALSQVSWPKAPNSVRLEGIIYQHIGVETGRNSWQELLKLVNHSAYSTSVYATLEAFFRQQGYPERADAVFVAQKRRERKEVLRGFAWCENLVLDILVRHGRSPGRAIAWGALLVIMGYLVFRRRDGMEPQQPEDASRSYNALWYSLDLFLPLIDLQAASVWLPKQDRRFARNYMRVHRILGWILIPVGLAAFTGIIK